MAKSARVTAVQQSWARARVLAALANTEGINSPITAARSYLSKAEPSTIELLDNEGQNPFAADKHNPKIREIVSEYENFVKAGRASKGNPKRPPRAGAPRKKTHKYRGKIGRTKTTKQTSELYALALIRGLQDEANNANTHTLSTDILLELKDLADKHGGIAQIALALGFLRKIQET